MKTKVLIKVCESDTDLTKTITQRVLEYLLKKYDDADIDELLNVCTYFDPRFKESYIDGEVKIALVKDRLAREDVEMLEDQNNTSEHTAGPPTTTEVSEDSEQTSVCGIKKHKLLS